MPTSSIWNFNSIPGLLKLVHVEEIWLVNSNEACRDFKSWNSIFAVSKWPIIKSIWSRLPFFAPLLFSILFEILPLIFAYCLYSNIDFLTLNFLNMLESFTLNPKIISIFLLFNISNFTFFMTNSYLTSPKVLILIIIIIHLRFFSEKVFNAVTNVEIEKTFAGS